MIVEEESASVRVMRVPQQVRVRVNEAGLLVTIHQLHPNAESWVGFAAVPFETDDLKLLEN